jgi:hypothetical protein
MNHHRLFSHQFDASAVERAIAVEDDQRSYDTDFVKYLGTFGIGIAELKRTPDFVDIRSDDRDDESAIVVHQPLGNPLKAHRLVGVASIAAMFPDKRIISFSNPGHPGSKHKRVSPLGALKVANGSLTDYMSYLEHYLVDQNVFEAAHVGESIGADLATEAGAQKGYASTAVIALDPGSNVPSTFRGMTGAFGSSNDAFRGYLHGNGQELSATSFDIAGDGDSYPKGLVRLTNLAMAKLVTRGNYADRATRAVMNGTDVYVAHATKSELCPPNPMRGLIGSLQAQDLGQNAGTMSGIELIGDNHSFPNDLALVNALVAQSIDQTNSRI